MYGGIAGVVMIAGWWLSSILLTDPDEGFDFEKGAIIGYVAMLLALSLVFIGIKNYRDKQQAGFITFKNAFLTGLYIVLVASVIYVIGWMIYYPNFMPDFADQYAAHQIHQYEESGMSAEEIQLKKEEMKSYMELYENPLIMAGMTFMEIFPIGLLITLISALILKRRPE